MSEQQSLNENENGSFSVSEVTELLAMLRNTSADEEMFGDTFAVLLERYLPLVEKVVGRFSDALSSELDREDLRQEALMSFYRAAMSYDLHQDRVSFGLYAQICMTNRMVSVVRRIKRMEEERPLPLGEDSDLPVAPQDDPAASFLKKERIEHTYAVIRRVLSPLELDVWQYYVRGNSASEIARALGRDEKSVSNAIGRIRKKLKEARADFDI